MDFLQRLKCTIPRSVGQAAGLLAVSVGLYCGAGALWGLSRPTLTGHAVGDGGGYEIESVADIEFLSFIGFVVLTALLSAGVGFVAYWRLASIRGVAMLLWVGVVAFWGAGAFYVFGSATAPSVPDSPSEVVHWAPAFNPGVGLLLSPLSATFIYWVASAVSVLAQWNEESFLRTEEKIEAL